MGAFFLRVYLVVHRSFYTRLTQALPATVDTSRMTLFALLGCLIIVGEVRYQLSQIRLRRLLRTQEYRLPL